MTDPFKHVVLLMLENHSFDQMLGCMQAVYPELDGVPPGPVARTNRDFRGQRYRQEPNDSLQVKPDPKHEHSNAVRQLAHGNGGFIQDYLDSYGDRAARDARRAIMGYFPRGFLPALHPLAEQFTVCDRWFASLPGPTWPNRLFALSGTSNGRVFMPEGDNHLSMLWTQTQDTIFDRLDEATPARSWRVYFYDFPASLLLRHQHRPEHLERYHRIDRFFADARGDADAFPEFVFIEPKYFGVDQNDDHPPHNIMKAQKLIADVYNAIRSNRALWLSTLLVVVYDEHGGFYDHVEPPAAPPPDGHCEEYTFDRLGVRVPAVLVSPWLDARVSSTRFDHTSVLKYLIDKWQLGPLGARAAAANSIAAAFGERTTPREDTIAFLRVPNSRLVADQPDWERQDGNTHHEGLHLLADLMQLGGYGEDDGDGDGRGAGHGHGHGYGREIEEAAARVARAAEECRRELPSWSAELGDRLIAWGRELRRPLEEAQRRRIERTQDAVGRRIPEE
jgi:phospholipase C